MIELLNSNFAPLKTGNRTFPDALFRLLNDAKSIKIASGFVSEDSIATLLGLYDRGYKAELNLIAGMGGIDGFPHAQFNALVSLGEVLRRGNFGNVFIAKVSRYHGKVYSFCSKRGNHTAILGSSNLTKISGGERLYDTDMLISDETLNAEIETFLTELQNQYCIPIERLTKDEIKIREPDNLFSDYLGVEKMHAADLYNVVNSLTRTKFEIPIKPEQKSHLNCYFGKGRKTPSGLIVPRDWYETDIMAGQEVRNKRGYPKFHTFTVITDDGYRFECVTNGAEAKSFRSHKDLKIIGRWLKGRMEVSGALQVGEFVSREVQQKYGRESFTLTETTIPNTWFLDYGVKNDIS